MLSPSDRARKDLGNPPRGRRVFPRDLPSGLLEIESREFDKFHAAREGLGDIFDDSRRCAAQYKRTDSIIRTINQNAQDIEQFGHDLDLVKDNDPIQGAEHQFRILEALKIRP